jgi:hypothetical protein
MLNEQLYQQLLAAIRIGLPRGLGGKTVKVNHRGRPFVGTVSVDPVTLKKKVKRKQTGEEYVVCCPFCRDTRYRLTLNHRWNVYDPVTDSRNLHLAQCYNEHCEVNYPGFHSELVKRLNPFFRQGLPDAPTGPVTVPVDKPTTLPGNLVPLHELSPLHPANVFFRERRHDPAKLSRNFGFAFCEHHRNPNIKGRIIMPIYQDGKLVSWQARYVDPTGNGSVTDTWRCDDCGNIFRQHVPSQAPAPGKMLISVVPLKKPRPARCPGCGSSGNIDRVIKYYTAGGTRKSETMINIDHARRWPFGVITEGWMDVLRVGSPDAEDEPGPSVALMGHKISDTQIKLAREAWGGKPLIFLLDPDAMAEQEETVSMLRGLFNPVVSVGLPDDRDPDETAHPLIWSLIVRTASLAGACLLPNPLQHSA